MRFKMKEEALRTEMKKFGDVTLVNLPKKEDGKLKGFGFITFDKLNDAKKAIDELNSRKEKFMGTKVACDWCLPKNLFIKNTEEAKAEADGASADNAKSESDLSDQESSEDNCK